MTETHPFIEVIAPTVDQAVARGLRDLGVAATRVQTEILDEGDLLEQRQARVRLTVLNEGELPDTVLQTSRDLLHELLRKMRLRGYQLKATWHDATPDEERTLVLDIQGEDLSLLIGRRGEHLAALQYLLRLMAHKKLNQPVNLTVDVESYKTRRAEQVKRMAVRAAEQAIQQERTITLEPMPPNERRLVHMTLRDNPHITTESIGTGETRKVTIIPAKK